MLLRPTLLIVVLLSIWLLPIQAISSTTIPLTDQEQAFLKAHPVLRVHNETNWAP
ncbi:MAG: hypothetical protein HQL53_14300, partial [Magnetococcales bacterium]|nr:hypothetical protein [Magnetococcales bacterium]